MDRNAYLRIASKIVRAEDSTPASKKTHLEVAKIMKKWAEDHKDLLKSDSKKYVEEMTKELEKHGWDRKDYIKEFGNKKDPRSLFHIVSPEARKWGSDRTASGPGGNDLFRSIASSLISVGFLPSEARTASLWLVDNWPS